MLRNEATYYLLSRATGVVAVIILSGDSEEVGFGLVGRSCQSAVLFGLRRLRWNASEPSLDTFLSGCVGE